MLRFTQFLLLSLACVAGRAASPLESTAKYVVLVFVSSECPISNRMAPEIERLSHKYPAGDVSFVLVYPNASDSEEIIKQHRHDYRLTVPFVRDPAHELVARAGVKVTPEAALFDKQRSVVYRGRINDQFLTLGKARPEASTHDLQDAIEAVLAGRSPKQAHIAGVGCYIE